MRIFPLKFCEEAGVSNGSFYHHFKTKDDLLSYYIEDQPALNPDFLEEPKSIQDVKRGIIRVYLNYVDYCKELGGLPLSPDTMTRRIRH